VLGLTFAGSALASVGFEVLTGGFKPWQVDYRLTGTLHSNAVAMEAGVVAIIAYAFALRGHDRKILGYSIFIAAVAVVVLTKTRTALGTVVVGVVAIHLVGRSAREWLLYATSAASLLAVGLITATVLDLPVERQVHKLVTLGRSGDDDSTLTGRVPLWEFIWHETAGRRLQGAGYGAFWLRERTEEASDSLHWFPRQSHNGYIEIMASLGFVGLALALAIGLSAQVRAAALGARVSRPENCALVALLCAAFVNCLTETAFVMPRDIGLVTAALVFSLVLQPSRQTAAGVSHNNNGTVRSATQFVPGRHARFPLPPGQRRQWSKS
jgi:O-antigen ligase